MKSMDPTELVKQPQDVTENPYRKPSKDGKKETPVAIEQVRFSIIF